MRPPKGRQAMNSIIEGACWTMAAALAERDLGGRL